ncbi:MAG: hypothetical protein KDD42_04780 [Bdellovibrionales bacterium]|nr:hypothetical protein [Bdellovibrionales bacterium]
MSDSPKRNFDKIHFWIQHYGHPGVEDRHAVETFVICESDEILNAFRYQLLTISKGDYDTDILKKLVGRGREARHGSFDEWAKLMLMWLHEYSKKA